MPASCIAYFDVDGTLTTRASMWSFLRFYLGKAHDQPKRYRTARHCLAAMRDRGTSRAEVNHAYVCHLAGASGSEVSRLGHEWFRHELRRGGFFHPPVLRELRTHQAVDHHAVLVSDSFPALLGPIADALDVNDVWCTAPEIRDGRYTGRLAAPPMLNERKATAVRLTALSAEIDPSDCVSYGDHVSDLSMLSSTGRAVVVGNDSTLNRVARNRNWQVLPGPSASPS